MSSRLRRFSGFAFLLVWSGIALALPLRIHYEPRWQLGVGDRHLQQQRRCDNSGGFATGGVAVNSTGARIYVANVDSVSVIDGASKSVIATVPVGVALFGVAVNPDGTRVYVADQGSDSVAVINASSNTVIATPCRWARRPAESWSTPRHPRLCNQHWKRQRLGDRYGHQPGNRENTSCGPTGVRRDQSGGHTPLRHPLRRQSERSSRRRAQRDRHCVEHENCRHSRLD